MIPARRATLLLCLAVAVACGDSQEPSKPVPGPLRVILTTPNSDDGALLLSITGPAVPTGLTPEPGLRLFQNGPAGTTTVVALTGPIQSGTVLTLQVEDTRKARRYQVTVQQAASAAYQLRDVSSYTVKVRE